MLPAPLACEIHAPNRPAAEALAAIARTCGHDLHQPLTVVPRLAERPDAPALITLHLPVELAATQHPAWCLACRLACFCPDARVSVLVEGAQAFASPRSSPRRREHRRPA